MLIDKGNSELLKGPRKVVQLPCFETRWVLVGPAILAVFITFDPRDLEGS